MTLDWAHLADRQGASLESLIARWLVRKYPDAQQVTPANNGDGGIDIYRSRPEGLVVWQVKGFTAALKPGQWQQIKDSWGRFVHEYVDAGEQIASYSLVTPWTPTMKRQRDYFDLTTGRDFPCFWHGDAWLQALDAEYPEITERWLHGEAALDRQLTTKALLASSQPAVRSHDIGYLDATTIRLKAVDELANKASEHYRIDPSFRTLAKGERPGPIPGQLGIMQRWEQVAEDRWLVQSLVPRGPGAAAADPLRITLNFSPSAGTDREEAARDWLEWGIPLTEPTPVLIQQTGGPFADVEPVERLIDSAYIGQVGGTPLPTFEFELVRDDGDQQRVMPLRLVEHTRGALTNWLRWVLETDGGLLRFEVRYAADDKSDRNDTEFEFRSTLGRALEGVRSDVDFLLATTPETVTTIRTTTGPSLLVMRGILPLEGLDMISALLDHLATLQKHSNEVFTAPNFLAVNDQQFNLIGRLVDIFEGTPFESVWDRGAIPPLGDQAESVQLNGNPFQLTYAREVVVGDAHYVISHPLVHYLYSANSATGTASATEETPVWAGSDQREVYWADPDWKRAA